MADQPATEPPLILETVECSPIDDERLAVRLHGRWQDRRHASEGRPILAVEVDGRVHRFPAVPPPRLPRIGRPSFWASSFVLPAWFAPRLEGHTSLSIGELEVEVRGFSASGNGSVRPPGESDAEGVVRPEPEPGADPVPAAGGGVEPVAGENEPAPDVVISVLRAQLQTRAAAQAHIQGELADARAELAARVANQESLRTTHDQLRSELEGLRGLVGEHDEQRAEVESRAVAMAAELSDAQARVGEFVAAREELTAERDVLVQEVATLRAALAAGIVTSDAATAEAEGLREELERLGAELAGARAALGSRDAGLEEAEALLGEARALSASLRTS